MRTTKHRQKRAADGIQRQHPIISQFFGLVILGLGLVASACNVSLDKGTTAASSSSDAATEAGTTDGGSGSAIALSGSLDLESGLGLNLTDETTAAAVSVEDIVVKATYADEPESTGILDDQGAFNLAIKPKPFSVTVFSGGKPVCNWIWQVGELKVGTIIPVGDINVGIVKCLDGQATIASEVAENAIDSDYKKSISEGKLSASVKKELINVNGLSVVPLIEFDEFKDQRRYESGPKEDLALAISPAVCKAGGFTIPEYFFTSYNAEGEKIENNTTAAEARNIFIKESVDGMVDLIVRDKGLDGQVVDKIFSGIKLEGVGAEFSLIGSYTLTPAELKSQVAEDRLREVMYSQDAGNENYATPRFVDEVCDPLDIVNRIMKAVNRAPYTDAKSIFPVSLWDNLSTYNWASDYNGTLPGATKDICSRVMGSEPLTLAEVCLDSNGKYITDFRTKYANQEVANAAASICNAKQTGKSVGYWLEKTDASGTPIKKCMKQVYDSTTYQYVTTVADIPITSCYTNYNYYSYNYTYYWVQTEYRSMGNDCSTMRKNGYTLRACKFEYDYSLEPTYYTTIDWSKYPTKYWGTTLDDIDALLLAQDKSNSTDMSQLISDIDHCIAPYTRTDDEVAKRSTNVDRLLSTLDLIQSATDEAGNKKYVTDSASEFKKAGSFQFTTAEITSLQTVLGKAKAAVNRWAKDVGKVKETFALLKTAAIRAANNACTQDQIATEASFKTIYSDFSKAYAGVANDAENRGIAGWQEVAYNHFACMEMDSNINKIRNFGFTAPMIGIKGSHQTLADQTKSKLGLVAEAAAQDSTPDDCDFINWQSKCVKHVRCKVPSGATAYVPFDYIIDTATIPEGCDTVETKIGVIGRKNRQEKTQNGVTIASGDITASMHMMTAFKTSTSGAAAGDFGKCSITIKMPTIDQDGCFVYTNVDGKNWATLTDEEIKTAKAQDFSLSYTNEVISLKDISLREVKDVLLKPNAAGKE